MKDVKKLNLRDQLIASVATLWNLNWNLLPTEGTCYRAIRGILCSSATREKLAMFYYFAIAKTEKERSRIKADYLKLGNAQRLRHTPYWQRYMEEKSLKVKSKSSVFVLPRLTYNRAKQMSRKELQQLEKEIVIVLKAIKKVLKEKKKVGAI